MELQACLEQRRSIRKFTDRAVEPTIIAALVDAASLAPSWKNTQVTRYYAVCDVQRKEQLLEAMPSFNRSACQSAPVVMVCTMVKHRSGYERDGSFSTPKGKGWQMYDCGCSNLAFCLAAQERGLGTVIMGYCDEEMIAQQLGLPNTEEICTILALGYPDEQPTMPKRKGSQEILTLL